MPGEFVHTTGKTRGGSIPLPVPPILSPDEGVEVEQRYHFYVRGLYVGNLSYDNPWGRVYTWLIETCRLNHLHLTFINTNADQKGKAFYVHLVFATRIQAQTAKAFFHENHVHMSTNRFNHRGLTAYSISSAKERGYLGAW